MNIEIGKSESGQRVMLDVPKLIDTRLLVQGASGCGKSWLLRGLAEQVAGKLQTIILDPEGEFVTLREKLDMVLVGRGGEVPAETRAAALLARRLKELQTSAVIDLYDLQLVDRRRFVRLFLESLMSLPRNLWGPTLVILDEAQKYCPQSGDADSAQAVIDLCSQGRKRGLCAALVTQRLSKLDKDAAAELGNVFIGRTVLDLDSKRATDILGMGNSDRGALRDLDDGWFFGFGPALSSRSVEKFKSRPVATTHPKAGQRHAMEPPKPSATIRRVLKEFADLPQQAAEEVKSLADAQKRIAQLERELKATNKPLDAQAIAQAEARGELRARKDVGDELRSLRAIVKEREGRLSKANAFLVKAVELTQQAPGLAVVNTMPLTAPKSPQVRPSAPQSVSPPPATRNTPSRPASHTGISTAQQRVLDAIAWWGSIDCPQPSRGQVAFAAGYTVNGHFNNVCGSLRSEGLIEYPMGDHLCFTDEGAAKANLPELAPTIDELHARIRAKLSSAQCRLFDVLVEAHREGTGPLSPEDLSSRAGYTVNGHFSNVRGSLRSLGLVEYVAGGTQASSLVFPEALA